MPCCKPLLWRELAFGRVFAHYECGANPEAYLEDVLMKVATTPASEIATLTPWAWAARQSND